jgi:flavin-dependent dehydrogenase
MIDLEAIKKHRALWEPDDCTSLPTICEHVDALIAEVERLCDVNDGYLLEMGRQHALLRDQKRGENAERAAVVAWLREQANSTTADVLRARDLDAADLIERGEHRKEEES